MKAVVEKDKEEDKGGSAKLSSYFPLHLLPYREDLVKASTASL